MRGQVDAADPRPGRWVEDRDRVAVVQAHEQLPVALDEVMCVPVTLGDHLELRPAVVAEGIGAQQVGAGPVEGPHPVAGDAHHGVSRRGREPVGDAPVIGDRRERADDEVGGGGDDVRARQIAVMVGRARGAREQQVEPHRRLA